MEDTIAAISTGLSPAGIGIVRISGEDAISLIGKIYRSKNKNKDITKEKSHTIHYGHIYDGDKLIDECLVMFMKGPRTYTGEDTIEINCHGGILSVKNVLATVLKYGARLAEPGEFTKRAFLNGKMDLSQAEAVMDLLSSKNQISLDNSMKQLNGKLKSKILELREKILYDIAFIESALDDPEHISLDSYPEKLLERVISEKEVLQKLINSSTDGKLLQEGIKTVILGKPNAGKSSILNALIGENKAIVTDIEGTTRDTVEEYINLGGITLNMIDTAGIRETDDVVEKIGVSKAIEKSKEADLILYVIDSSRALDDNDYNIMDLIKDKETIVIYNKTDLNPVVDISEIKSRLGHNIIQISALKEKGIDTLVEEIKAMFFSGNIDLNEDIVITKDRHKHLLQEAYNSLNLVEGSINSGLPEDFFSIDLLNAYTSLGKIIGEEVEEDVVKEIFAKFCTGK